MTDLQLFNATMALLGHSDTYYLISIDMDSNYSYLNKRYEGIFEPIHGSLVGKHYALTLHKDDLQTCQIVAEKAFLNRNSVFPATLRKHDGKGGYIITRWEYKAIFDHNNLPAGMFCIGHDITEFVQLSDQLQNIKLSHSHSVRRHAANLLGLGKLIQEARDLEDMQDAAKMIVQSADDLDKVIRELGT